MSGRHLDLGVAEARPRFYELVDKMRMGEVDRVDITHRGRPAAALVSRGYLENLIHAEPHASAAERVMRWYRENQATADAIIREWAVDKMNESPIH